MNLTVQNKEALTALPPSLQPFVINRQEVPFSNLNKAPALKICLDVITKSFFDSGTNLPADKDQAAQMLQFQAQALFEELSGKYGSLTPSEISEAFKRGIRGDFGQWFGICPKTYHQFLKSYFELPERSKAWSEYLSLVEATAKSDKPVYFTREHFIKAAKDAFEEYKACGKLPMVSHAIYDTIRELKGVKTLIRADEWATIKAEAQNSYEEQMTKGVHKSRVGEILARLDYTLPDKNGNGNRSFEFHVKKIALKRYFDSIDKLEI